MPLDRTDLAILRILEERGRISFAALGEAVGLSKTPCWARVRELEKRGLIRAYRADVEPAAIGLALHAFVQVTISAERHGEFEAAIGRQPAVLECFTTAGQGDYLLHVLVPDILALDELLRAELARLPGVQRLTTTVCMKTIKQRSTVTQCLRPPAGRAAQRAP